MMKIVYLPLLLLLITACGGGGGGGNGDTSYPPQIQEEPENTDSETNQGNDWIQFSGEDNESGGSGIGIAIERKGEDIYISYNTYSRRNLFRTQDGESFHAYYTSSTSAFVSFIDELNRIYLQGEYTDSDEFFDLEDGIPFGGYVNGNSSTLIIMGHSPKSGILAGSRLEISTDRGNTLDYIDLDQNRDTTREVSASEPAFNGINTFIVPSIEAGLWISQDSGVNWNNVLSERGRFDVVVGNSLFPTQFAAIRRGDLLVSMDTGETWQRLEPPQDNQEEIAEWIDLELLDDGQLVAWGIPINSENGIGQVFKSDNFGQSWSKVGSPIGYSSSNLGNLTIPNLEANSQYYFINANGEFYKLAR